MQDFKGLNVWEKAHVLTVDVYRATSGFPRFEAFGLTSQLRRSCASIPANIAEGCGRRSRNEFAQFLQAAIGSANEVEYHLILARDLGYLPIDRHDPFDHQVAEVRRMLVRLVARVRPGSKALSEIS